VQWGDKLKDSKASELERAEKICDNVISLGTALQLRYIYQCRNCSFVCSDIVVTMSRIQMLRSGQIAAKGGPETQVLFQLEVIRSAPSNTTAVEKAVTLINAVKKDDCDRLLVFAVSNLSPSLF